MSNLEQELKELIIDSLNLEHLTPNDIDVKAPLFKEGLGLDSIDALELGLAIQKKYRIVISDEDPEVRTHFSSVTNLAQFIAANRK